MWQTHSFFSGYWSFLSYLSPFVWFLLHFCGFLALSSVWKSIFPLSGTKQGKTKESPCVGFPFTGLNQQHNKVEFFCRCLQGECPFYTSSRLDEFRELAQSSGVKYVLWWNQNMFVKPSEMNVFLLLSLKHSTCFTLCILRYTWRPFVSRLKSYTQRMLRKHLFRPSGIKTTGTRVASDTGGLGTKATMLPSKFWESYLSDAVENENYAL